MKGCDKMIKENKNSRIEIRLSSSIKEQFQEIAKKKNTTISKLLYGFIINTIKEEKINGIQN